MNLSDESLKDLNLCLNTRCNLCRDECPEYNKNKAEFNSPRGKLELIYEFLNKTINKSDVVNVASCYTTCDKCNSLCPLDINIIKIFHEFENLFNNTD